MVTSMDRQVCCNFHGMVQCYGQMLRIAVMLKQVHMHTLEVRQHQTEAAHHSLYSTRMNCTCLPCNKHQ